MWQFTNETRKGFAIIAVIVGVLVLSTLTMTGLEMGAQDTRSARATRVSASALYVAETGVHRVRASWPTEQIGPGQSRDLDWFELANGSRYRAVIRRRDRGGDGVTGTALSVATMEIYSLTVDGVGPAPLGGQATVQVWATRFNRTARFRTAVSAQGDIRVRGTVSVIDSYDSRLEPPYYCNAAMIAADPPQCTTLNVGQDGDIHANGSIIVSGGAQIEGDAASASGEDAIVDRHDGIAGVERFAPPEVYPVDPCPDYTESMPGDVYTKPDFEMGSGAYYAMPGGTYSFRNFTMNSRAVLEVPDGQAVTVFISGELKMTGQPEIRNGNRAASAVAFLACNRPGDHVNERWELAGGAEAYFTVYAPNNDVTVAGSSPVFGSIVGNNVVATGGASVHYDIALGVLDDSPEARSAIIPRSWRQLLR